MTDESTGAIEVADSSPAASNDEALGARIDAIAESLWGDGDKAADKAEEAPADADKALDEAVKGKTEPKKAEKQDKAEKTEPKDGAKKDAAAKDEEDPDQPEENPEGERPADAIAAPNSWSADMKAKWNEVPPDAQAYIAQRETEAHGRIAELGQEVSRLQPYKEYGELVEKHQEIFDRHDMDANSGLQTLIAAQDALDKQPVDALRAIAQSVGIDLDATFRSPHPQTPQHDQQELMQLRSQNRALTNQLAMRDNAQRRQTQRQTETMQQRERDALDKWLKNGTEKPHFEKVRKGMASLVEANPKATYDELYDMACNADPTIRAELAQAKQQKQSQEDLSERQRRVDDAKRNAAVNSGSKPARQAKPANWDDDDALSRTFDRIQKRRAG